MQSGTVYLAPQDHHTTLEKGGRIQLSRGERVNFVRPAADPLFVSSARVFGHRAVGIVLSGSCSDGAEGAAELIAAGARVYVQSKESCSYTSMPLAATRKCNLSTSFTPAELIVLLVSIGMCEIAMDPL